MGTGEVGVVRLRFHLQYKNEEHTFPHNFQCQKFRFAPFISAEGTSHDLLSPPETLKICRVPCFAVRHDAERCTVKM